MGTAQQPPRACNVPAGQGGSDGSAARGAPIGQQRLHTRNRKPHRIAQPLEGGQRAHLAAVADGELRPHDHAVHVQGLVEHSQELGGPQVGELQVKGQRDH